MYDTKEFLFQSPLCSVQIGTESPIELITYKLSKLVNLSLQIAPLV